MIKLLFVLALVAPTAATAEHISPRLALVRHDSEGRLANTTIKKLGELQAGPNKYLIYNVLFVNPVSRHGMRHVAIFVRGGFIGAYRVDNGALSIKGNRVVFGGPTAFDKGAILFTKSGPPAQAFIQGEVRNLEHTI